MRFISFFIFFLSGFVVNSTFSSDEVSKSLESYRPGNVYEEIDISSYPQPTSAKDGIQLCHSLIEGEIQYWEDSKTSMLNDNSRLKNLVSLIAKNKMNLGLRLRLLEKKEDNDMYSLYKSYETIIEGLQSFSSILNGISVSESPSGNQEGLLLIGSALKGLSEKNTEILKKNMLLRGILNSSVLGKSKFDVIQGEKGKFQPGTKSDSGQYDFCDVEYISVVFFPLIKQILHSAKVMLEDEGKKTDHPKKRKKKKKKKPQSAPSSQRSTQAAGFPQERKGEPVDLSASAPLPEALVQPESHHSLPSLSGGQEGIESSIPELSVGESSSQVLHSGAEDYDPEPWKKYEKKDPASGKVVGKPVSEEKASLLPAFSLDDENAFTAQILLGTEKETACENVRMDQYIKLIKALGGSVLNRKKCAHFMARSRVDQQWRSVAMHRLHQDDPHIIPRNTRYWKIAKQLLIDIGLSEQSSVQ